MFRAAPWHWSRVAVSLPRSAWWVQRVQRDPPVQQAPREQPEQPVHPEHPEQSVQQEPREQWGLREPWEQWGLQVPRALVPRDLQELRGSSGPRVYEEPRAPREPQGLAPRESWVQ